MSVTMYFKCRNNEGEYTQPSVETITTIAEIILGRRVDYRAYRESRRVYYEAPEGDGQHIAFPEWEAYCAAGGMLLSDLDCACLSSDPNVVLLAAELTGQDYDQGSTTDRFIIQHVIQAIYPGLVGNRVAQFIDLLGWSY